MTILHSVRGRQNWSRRPIGFVANAIATERCSWYVYGGRAIEWGFRWRRSGAGFGGDADRAFPDLTQIQRRDAGLNGLVLRLLCLAHRERHFTRGFGRSPSQIGKNLSLSLLLLFAPKHHPRDAALRSTFPVWSYQGGSLSHRSSPLKSTCRISTSLTSDFLPVLFIRDRRRLTITVYEDRTSPL